MRVSNTREDDFIRDCILDAWSFIDGPNGMVRRAVLPQTWQFTTPSFRVGWLMPVQRAREIVSIRYWSEAGEDTAIAAANFFLAPHRDEIGTTLFFRRSYVFPRVYDRHDAITVTFTAGFRDVTAVPRVFRRALQLIAAHLYDNREETYADNRVTKVPRRIKLGAEKLLEKWIVPLDYAGGT